MTGRSLVIDGGKSKTAAAIVDDAGHVIAHTTGPGLAIIGEPGGADALTRSLCQTLETLRALDSLGASGEFDTAVFGLNGVHAPSPDTDAAAAILRGLVDARRVVVCSDGVLAYVGALGIEPGVVVTAGTGTVLLAVGRDGLAYRVDGDGPLLGDRGSGYSLGLAGLREAMRVVDGLHGSQRLADEFRREYGTADRAVSVIHGDADPTRLIATFSRNVARAAQEGDPVARALWREAARDLVRGAVAAADRAGLAGSVYAVACSGGLFGAGALLLDPLAEALARVAPTAVLSSARADALGGGATLATSKRPELTGVTSWY